MATNRSPIYLGLAAAVVLLGGTAVAVSSLSSGSAAPGADPHTNFGTGLAVAHRPALPADAVPKEVLALPPAAQFDTVRLTEARRVATRGGRSYWMVPGTADQICLIAASGSGDTFESAGTCAPPSQLAKGGIWFSEVDGNGDNQVVLLAPDSVDSFRSPDGKETAVSGNLSVLTVLASSPAPTLTVVSKSGDVDKLDLGTLAPPAQ